MNYPSFYGLDALKLIAKMATRPFFQCPQVATGSFSLLAPLNVFRIHSQIPPQTSGRNKKTHLATWAPRQKSVFQYFVVGFNFLQQWPWSTRIVLLPFTEILRNVWGEEEVKAFMISRFGLMIVSGIAISKHHLHHF